MKAPWGVGEVSVRAPRGECSVVGLPRAPHPLHCTRVTITLLTVFFWVFFLVLFFLEFFYRLDTTWYKVRTYFLQCIWNPVEVSCACRKQLTASDCCGQSSLLIFDLGEVRDDLFWMWDQTRLFLRGFRHRLFKVGLRGNGPSHLVQIHDQGRHRGF